MLGETVAELLSQYFVRSGLGWAVAGAMSAVMLAGVGSARGIRIAASQAAGVLSEKPELFGKLFVLMALPGTQGFYGFICAIMICLRVGLLGGQKVTVSPLVGLGLFFIGFCMGVVEWRSAIYQGETSAAAINLVGRKPEESGRAILLPGLVETYAVLALLTSILLILWVTAEGLVLVNPMMSPA